MTGKLPIGKKRFLVVWSSHTFLIIILKLYGFIVINLLLQEFITPAQYPIYGGFSYLIVIGLLLIIPSILRKRTVIWSLNICLYTCGIIFLLLWIYSTVYSNTLTFLVLSLTLFLFMGAIESIFFDRFVSAYCSIDDLPFAISWTRQANTFAYIISPLLGGFIYEKISIAYLLGIGIGVLLWYRATLFLLPSVNPMLAAHQQPSTLQMSGLIRNNQQFLYLFSLNFFWLGIVSIMLIPYLQINFSVNQIGIILSCAGLGLLVGNAGATRLVQKLKFIEIYRLCASLFVLFLCAFVLASRMYLPSCILIFSGSLISSFAYVSAQFFLQKEVDSADLVTFYALRNLMNAGITLVMFILLWLFLTSGVGLWIKVQFHLNEYHLFSLFFIFLAILASLGYYLLAYTDVKAQKPGRGLD